MDAEYLNREFGWRRCRSGETSASGEGALDPDDESTLYDLVTADGGFNSVVRRVCNPFVTKYL